MLCAHHAMVAVGRAVLDLRLILLLSLLLLLSQDITGSTPLLYFAEMATVDHAVSQAGRHLTPLGLEVDYELELEATTEPRLRPCTTPLRSACS
jgi:hypothetical protein